MIGQLAILDRLLSGIPYLFRELRRSDLNRGVFREIERHRNLAIYIHQMAMDAHGDFYVATVYPEHAGARRGREGPSHHRWTRQAVAAAVT